MRAQLSLELLLGLAAAYLLASWSVGYATAGLTPDAALPSAAQHLAAAQRLATAADEACLGQVSVTIATPCIYKGRTSLAYSVSAAQGELRVTSGVANASAALGCGLDLSLLSALQCANNTFSAGGLPVCMQPFGNGSRLVYGACS